MSRSFITRKEIAAILEVSVDTVRRQERAWGIFEFRRQLSARQIDYRRDAAMRALAALRLLPDSR